MVTMGLMAESSDATQFILLRYPNLVLKHKGKILKKCQHKVSIIMSS